MSRPPQSCLATLAIYPKSISPCPMCPPVPCSGRYGPIIYSLHLKTEGTIALGETWGVVVDLVPAFMGPLLLCSGERSAVFCGNDTRGSCLPVDTSTIIGTKNFFGTRRASLTSWLMSAGMLSSSTISLYCSAGFQGYPCLDQ